MKKLITTVQCSYQPVVKQQIEFLSSSRIISGQETDESLSTLPGAGSSLSQIVVEQLCDQVLVVELWSGDLQCGQCLQQCQTVLHTGSCTAITCHTRVVTNLETTSPNS